MRRLRVLFADQLSASLSALRDADLHQDTVFMAEVDEELTREPHHKQKITLILAAMRCFAEQLRESGFNLEYIALDDPQNAGTLTAEVRRALQRGRYDALVVTEPGEYAGMRMVEDWSGLFGLPVEVRPDDRFLCSIPEFQQWARGRRELRMEYFYRYMRRRYGWLMEDGAPVGGRWNFDAENRKPLPAAAAVPEWVRKRPDSKVQEVMELVESRFPHHFGSLSGFGWAVDRDGALQVLSHFVEERLPRFGDYQDAMRSGETLLFHSGISPYLNIGLLTPREVVERVLAAYEAGAVSLSSAEGFIRQVIGWREFIRGVYWTNMPGYPESNFFQAHRRLPDFFWNAETPMRCIRETVQAAIDHAYAHHIQRLMVTGNFALLAGLEPAEVERWYLAVFADAFEWVELPNTHGMVLHADGGMVGSKPYAASGAYISRMSDYCSRCAYSPKKRTGEGACPFNFLYWNFIFEHEQKLRENPRMALVLKSASGFTADARQEIRAEAQRFLGGILHNSAAYGNLLVIEADGSIIEVMR